MSEVLLSNYPSSDELWSGIGGHFDSLGQIINEFIDNSISNFEGNNCIHRQILLHIKEESEGGDVTITIEDSGTGIKNLDKAFTLGSRDAAESPLNEHGFGLKHALASANPDNNSWCISTKTQSDLESQVFKQIKAPYKIKDFTYEICSGELWPGTFMTGTVIVFTCSRSMYATIARGIQGGMRNLIPIANVLHEEIGFTYSGLIKENKVSITMIITDAHDNTQNYQVGAVEPSYNDWYEPGEGQETVDLGGGQVLVQFQFGKINDKNARRDFDNTTTRKYYRQNMSSSGVEIRINGRCICSNLFKEIWGVEKHNSYNSLLVRINIKSQNRDALPKTRTSKNGLREGDPRLESLFEWIRGYMSKPIKDMSQVTHEIDLFEQLRDTKLAFLPDPKVVETEKTVFNTGNPADKVRIDLYEKFNNVVTIYEGKIDSTTSKDVYQLRMYWDGLLYDGIKPHKGILIAKEHPESVKNLITLVNSMLDASGQYYCLEMKKWSDYNL